MKFAREDNDNCRVYYRNGGRLYCWQLDEPGSFLFYSCTSDGEPSHPTTAPDNMPAPPKQTSIGREFDTFLTKRAAKRI